MNKMILLVFAGAFGLATGALAMRGTPSTGDANAIEPTGGQCVESVAAAVPSATMMASVPFAVQIPVPEFAGPIERPQPVESISYTVGPGESFRRIFHMWGVGKEALWRMNPDKRVAELHEGLELKVYERPSSLKSISVGRAHRGHLIDGVPLPEGPGYRILYRHRTFGTHYAVDELVDLFDLLHLKYPDAHDLVVGDLSFPRGYQITPHKSHRNGRDVDIGFYHVGLDPDGHFVRATPENFDDDRNWFMIHELIASGSVEFIFLDRMLQLRLRREAAREGYSAKEIDAWFQVPSDGHKAQAIIRHVRGHRDHIHVRFKCHPTDADNCR